MKLEGMAMVLHPEYLRVALTISLVSVWVLVGLFFWLYRYVRRDYFGLWSVAWLFYALWLTLSMRMGDPGVGSITFTLKQGLLSLSAVMLLWGSLRFLEFPVSERLIAGFGVFLLVWIFLSTQVMLSVLLVEFPVFMLLGLGSPFAGLSFLRLRRQKSLVGAGMLSLGFLLWGIYLGSYPFANQYGRLYSAGFLGAAVLQFVVAAGMIALVCEEIRSSAGRDRPDSGAGRPRKDSSQLEVFTAREERPILPDHVHWKEGKRKVHQELLRTEQALVQQERLLALGQMVSGVAHDINCALSPLTAYSELLLSTLPDLADAPPQRLEKISEAAEDVARIVARLRELYRRDLDPDQLAKGNESSRLRWPALAPHPGTSLQKKFEHLLVECSGDLAAAQPEGIGPMRWFSLKKGRPRTA